MMFARDWLEECTGVSSRGLGPWQSEVAEWDEDEEWEGDSEFIPGLCNPQHFPIDRVSGDHRAPSTLAERTWNWVKELDLARLEANQALAQRLQAEQALDALPRGTFTVPRHASRAFYRQFSEVRRAKADLGQAL